VAGRPSLRIGAYGRIIRKPLGGGVWLAQCQYRDSDGVTRRVQRLSPPNVHDQYGKLAENALIEAIAERQPPAGAPGALTPETLVSALVEQHLERLAEDGRAPATLDWTRTDSRSESSPSS